MSELLLSVSRLCSNSDIFIFYFFTVTVMVTFFLPDFTVIFAFPGEVNKPHREIFSLKTDSKTACETAGCKLLLFFYKHIFS